MSESEGLQKLIEYLKQTRRQAESAIDVLNEKIKELTETNESYLNTIKKLENECSRYKQVIDQMKLENSSKYKFAERDEWKALLSSVQQDRSRLQEEYNLLENEYEQSKQEIAYLQEEINELLHEKQQREQTYDINNISTDATDNTSLKFDSPRSMKSSSNGFNGENQTEYIRQLKNELKKTKLELENEVKQSEMNNLYNQSEINRLNEALNIYQPMNHHHQQVHNTLNNQGEDKKTSYSNNMTSHPNGLFPPSSTSSSSESKSNWFGDSIFKYFFIHHDHSHTSHYNLSSNPTGGKILLV